MVENAAARGDQLYRGLLRLQEKHAAIGDVRGGHGLMCAVELVRARASKAAPDKALGPRVLQATYEAGVMIRVSGPNIILSPSLVISEADIDVILAALDTGLAVAA